MQYEWFKATTVQYEALRVDWCQNKEKLKLLAESLVPRYTGWAKCYKVWACSAWVERGEWSECLNLNLLLFAAVQFSCCFVTALLKENDSLYSEELRYT